MLYHLFQYGVKRNLKIKLTSVCILVLDALSGNAYGISNLLRLNNFRMITFATFNSDNIYFIK